MTSDLDLRSREINSLWGVARGGCVFQMCDGYMGVHNLIHVEGGNGIVEVIIVKDDYNIN